MIGSDLFVMFLSVAIFTTVLLLAIVFGEQDCSVRDSFVKIRRY